MRNWSDWARHFLPGPTATNAARCPTTSAARTPCRPIRWRSFLRLRCALSGPLADATRQDLPQSTPPIIEAPWTCWRVSADKCGPGSPALESTGRSRGGPVPAWEAESQPLLAGRAHRQVAGCGRGAFTDRGRWPSWPSGSLPPADDLVACQDSDGYLGTYNPQTSPDGPGRLSLPLQWDIWTHRYNIVGLLSAHRHLAGKQAWLDAVSRG